MNQESTPIQKFLQTKFTQRELMATRREEVYKISNILNQLSVEEVLLIGEFRDFLNKHYEIPKKNTESFIPSPTFNGSIKGYVFTTRNMGTGYYKE